MDVSIYGRFEHLWRPAKAMRMNEDQSTAELTKAPPADVDERDDLPGIIPDLAALPAEAIVREAELARMFGRYPVTIKRAVKRGELPPPVRLLGGPAWTVGAIRRHLDKRLELTCPGCGKVSYTRAN